MKLKELGEKTLEVIKKVNRKVLISTGAVLIIGVAVLLNFLLLPTGTKVPEAEKDVTPAVDLTDVVGALEDRDVLTGKTEGDMFAQMSLSRQQARDEAIEVLNAVAASETAEEDAKAEALSEIREIAQAIENEANIESLVKSKGFEECVAVISGNRAQVIVKTDGLLQNEVAQISEIVYEQANITPDNLHIIESKN